MANTNEILYAIKVLEMVRDGLCKCETCNKGKIYINNEIKELRKQIGLCK